MSHSKSRRRGERAPRSDRMQQFLEHLRAEPDAEDGVDPRILARHHRRAESTDAARDRKLLQLCEQVRRALSLALGELSDPLLADLDVVAVTPAPDASRLRVSLRSSDSDLAGAAAEITRRLDRAHGRLRSEAARAVRRRRAPDLHFVVLRGGEDVR